MSEVRGTGVDRKGSGYSRIELPWPCWGGTGRGD